MRLPRRPSAPAPGNASRSTRCGHGRRRPLWFVSIKYGTTAIQKGWSGLGCGCGDWPPPGPVPAPCVHRGIQAQRLPSARLNWTHSQELLGKRRLSSQVVVDCRILPIVLRAQFPRVRSGALRFADGVQAGADALAVAVHPSDGFPHIQPVALHSDGPCRR